LDDITRIVHISEQKEEIIHTPGFMNDYKIRGNEHYIVWTEQIPDVRWQNVNYSVIKLYNRKTGKVEQIGKKSRFYSPTINDKNLAFIEIRNTESVIFVYSLEEKTIIDSIKAEGIHFVDPQLINNDELVVILHENSGQSVALVNLKTHEIELLTENTFYEIKDPYIVDSTLFYISGENGTNNLYAISLKTKVKKQVTNVRYGIDGLSFSDHKLFFANYLSNGNNIGLIEVENALEQDYSAEFDGFLFVDSLVSQENFVANDKTISTNRYKIEKYNRFANLFNIHSWGLLYYNLDDFDFNPGITLLGQNVLNSSFLSLSYEKNLGLDADIYRIDWSYRGFYPRIDNAITFTKFDSYFLTHDDVLLKYPVEQTSYDIDISIPFNFSRNKYSKFIQPQIGHSFIHRKVDNIWSDSVFNGNINSLNYALYVSYTLKKAHQHIYPKFGFELRYQYKHTPFSENDLGSIISIENKIYFPGILKNQSFIINGGYQSKQFGYYQYADIQNVARGYTNPVNTEMLNLQLNYTFPVSYPDLSISSFAYIKRIYFNVFHDYTQAYFPNHDINYLQSSGFDIIGDMHLLRTILPLKTGVRAIYLHDLNKLRFEFLFRIDLSGL